VKKNKIKHDETPEDLTEEEFPELEPVPQPFVPYQVIININLAPTMGPQGAPSITLQHGTAREVPEQDVQGLCHYGGPSYGRGCTKTGGYKCARCGLRG
jgi:hypothetical protein